MAAPEGFGGDAWQLAVWGEGTTNSTLAAGHDDRGYPLWRARTSDDLTRRPAATWPNEEPEFGNAESEVVLIGGDAISAHGFSSSALAVPFGGKPGPTALHAYASGRWPGPTTASARAPHSAPWSIVENASRANQAEPPDAPPAECPDQAEPADDEPPYILGDVVLGAWRRR